jgi:raffinose/stachyose/melibiose transport system permease protein
MRSPHLSNEEGSATVNIYVPQGFNKKNEVPVSSSRRTQNNVAIFLFLLPAFALFLIFQVFPIFQSAYYSLFNWTGFGAAVDYVGLDNFQRILVDAVFQKAVLNVLLIIVFSLLIQLPFALVLAILVGRDLPGKAFFRMIFFMPYVISEVITAIMWLGLFNPDSSRGLINAILTQIPGVAAQPWLGNTDTVLPCIFIVLTWKYFGLYMLLYLAGLQAIPLEIEEAAQIDGANSFQLARYITVPMLRDTIQTTVYLSVLGSMQQFILVWIMTKGGPVNASEVMATYMYRFGFIRFWLGYGSAVAIFMLIIAITFSLVYQRFFRAVD